jgi:predicted CoA-substrate-specific enzyme activase
MISAGIDIGSRTSKGLIIRDQKIIAYEISLTGDNMNESANSVLNKVLEKSNLKLKNLDFIVSTGIGRKLVDISNMEISDILCTAKGASRLFPKGRTVLDIGAENCRAIRCDNNGIVKSFEVNDKCAAGTGIFLETAADILNLRLEEIGETYLDSEKKINMNSTCAVFGETEIISLIHQGFKEKTIMSAINSSIAQRAYHMIKKIGVEREVVNTGGVACNKGFNIELNNLLGFNVVIPEEPQITGALGAAIIAEQKARG